MGAVRLHLSFSKWSIYYLERKLEKYESDSSQENALYKVCITCLASLLPTVDVRQFSDFCLGILSKKPYFGSQIQV